MELKIPVPQIQNIFRKLKFHSLLQNKSNILLSYVRYRRYY